MECIGGYNPLILTIDPNFQRDIQVDHSSRSMAMTMINIGIDVCPVDSLWILAAWPRESISVHSVLYFQIIKLFICTYTIHTMGTHNLHFKGIQPIVWWCKTVLFHGFGVQGYIYIYIINIYIYIYYHFLLFCFYVSSIISCIEPFLGYLSRDHLDSTLAVRHRFDILQG